MNPNSVLPKAPTFAGMLRNLTKWLGKPVATPETDPERFFGALFALPNPDPILRQMGRAEQVYYSILQDPHVLGDVRSIRGNFRSHTYRLLPGDEGDTKSLAAHQLCEEWIQRCQPNKLSDWLEVMWQMSSSFMTGYRAHELIWQLQDGLYLPAQVIDRPQRRFKFNNAADPLLVSTSNMLGAPVEPYQFAISRHMADHTNPYGIAVLSACFWAWTFKTGGWRYFVKYCERHGLPWPVGRYPMGTSDKEQDALANALAEMVEAGYVIAPEGTGLELLTPTGSGAGGTPQQHLIDLANREMSKALTGQAMVAELQGAGARAASETAMKRQESIDDSVRDISAGTMGDIFRWITLFNFGDGIAPPTLEFFQHENAGKDRAETYQIAANVGARPSRKGMLEELGIAEAEDDADALLPAAAKAQPVPPTGKGPDSAATAGSTSAALAGDGADFAMSEPAPIYASRRVLNADEVIRWANVHNLKPVAADELHVTVAFSRTAVAPGAIAPDDRDLVVPNGDREVKPLGTDGALVLRIAHPLLNDRWQAYLDAGASWDHPGYQPHVTISYDAADINPADIEPFDGLIVLGPEVIEPLKLDAATGKADFAGIAGFEFALAAGMTEDEALALATEAADQAIADNMIRPVAEMLAGYEADGKTLAQFKADLEKMVGAMDDEALREVLTRSLQYSALRGAATRAA